MSLVVLAFGAYFAWRWGYEAGVFLAGPGNPNGNFFGYGSMFVAGAIVGTFAYASFLLPIWRILKWPFSRSDSGGCSILETAPGRRVIGVFAGLCARLLAGWYILCFLPLVLYLAGFSLLVGGVLALVVALAFVPKRHVVLAKAAVAMIGRPVIELDRARHRDQGGAARFAGIVQEWGTPWRPGRILLGGSIYDGTRVGVADDRHILTIATSRSGKGRSAIIPNLLTWPGSVLVIDPKGQNAAVTAKTRERFGQQVYIVDPFNELERVGVSLPTHRINPLADLDPLDPEFAERVGLLGEALAPRSDAANHFWDDSAESVISGLIGHAVTWPDIPDERRNLGLVREWLIRQEGLPLSDMARNAMAPMAQAAAAFINDNSSNTKAGVMATARTHTKWLDSTAMRNVFAKSDFSLKTIKTTPASVFIVLPTEYLDLHGRFLRLFVNTCIHSASRGAKPNHDVLFIMDEFYALGRLSMISKAAGALAGYGVKLWPIVQNLSQIQEHYPKNWETFLGNAGVCQVFAVNDRIRPAKATGHV